MSDDASSPWERFLSEDVRDTLKSMCCVPLQFMWDNSLLAPRDQWYGGDEDVNGHIVHSRILLGFRVVRDFMIFRRDQVLYRCPFCQTELVVPLGFASDGPGLGLRHIGYRKGVTEFNLPKSLLEQGLSETKRQCRGVWPPKD